MKATYKNMVIAALALSAVACSQDEDFTSAYLSDPDAVRITAQVGDVTGGFTRSNPIGTEDEQKTFNSGDKIGVSAGSQAAVVYTLDADGKTWKPETDKYLKWESSPMNFTAWHPANGNTDAKNFTPQYNATAETDADSHLAELQANDYMTYSGEQSKTDDNSVALTMERQMVRIVISKIDYNNQYNDNAVVAIAITSGSSKYENGAWTDDNITAQMYKHSDNKWYAVLPPTAITKDNETFLSITLNEEDNPLIVKGIPATEAGKSYDYTLTVGKDVATIGSVSVTDWKTGGTIPGGEAKEYNFTISGTVAVISEFYSSTPSLVSKAINEIYGTESNITDIVVNTTLTEEQQRAFATALSEKTVILYLPQMPTESLVDELKNNENISVICPITDPSQTAMGDLALFDGTFIDTDDLDKVSKSNYLKSKVGGIVFWTTKDSNTGGNTPAKLTDDKVMTVDFPNCKHGLIVALKDISEGLKWQNTCESVYDVFQNTDSFTPTNKPDYASIQTGYSAKDNITKILGYNNTKVLRAYNKHCSSNGKSSYIVNPVAKLDEWEKSNKAPENTTGWFIPSAKELHILSYKDVDNNYNMSSISDTNTQIVKNTVNKSLQKIGGSQFGENRYWSSSEFGTNVAVSCFFSNPNAANREYKTNTKSQYTGPYKFRAVCAF